MNLLVKSILSILFGFSIVFGSINLEVDAVSVNQKDRLIEKVSKDFTNKFCNGIGFGLSKESAMNFAFNENKQVYQNKKGIENIENDLLSEAISTSVIEKCGYPLNLNGEKGTIQFKKDYLSMIDNLK